MTERSNRAEKSTVRKVIGYASTALIAAVLVFVVVALVGAFTSVAKGQAPTVLGYRVYTVLTDSMTPTIQPGDVIISKKVTAKRVKELQTGDIITYIAERGEMAGKTVTHRIVEAVHYDESLGAEVVTTRGDKPGAALDYPVRTERIQSVMVRNSAGLKWFYGLFRTGAGFALIIILPLGVMLVSLVVRLVMTLRKPKEEEVTPAPAAPVATAPDAEQEARIAEIKARAIAEYMAKQSEQSAQAEQPEQTEQSAQSEDAEQTEKSEQEE